MLSQTASVWDEVDTQGSLLLRAKKAWRAWLMWLPGAICLLAAGALIWGAYSLLSQLDWSFFDRPERAGLRAYHESGEALAVEEIWKVNKCQIDAIEVANLNYPRSSPEDAMGLFAACVRAEGLQTEACVASDKDCKIIDIFQMKRALR